MKKSICSILLLLSISFILSYSAMAGIETQNVRNKLIKVIQSINGRCITASSSISSLKQMGIDLVTSNEGDIEETDRTKLTEFNALVVTALNAIDAVVAYDWGYMD